MSNASFPSSAVERRASRSSRECVVCPLLPYLHFAIDDRISHCRGDQISAYPSVVLVEIHHLRSVIKVTVEARWIAVLRQVLIERIIGGPIDLVTVEKTNSVWPVASIELLGDFLVDLRLGAPLVAPPKQPAGNR